MALQSTTDSRVRKAINDLFAAYENDGGASNHPLLENALNDLGMVVHESKDAT